MDTPRYLRCLVFGTLLVLLPASGFSQGFRYTATTQFSVAGTTGEAVSMVADLTNLNEVSQTYTVQGEVLRVDQGNRSTLYDLDARRIVTMEGDACSVTTFEHLKQQVDASAAASSPEGTDAGTTNYDLSEVQLDFSVEPGGEAEQVGAYWVTPTTFTITADAGGGRMAGAMDGTLVIVSDVGLAQNVDGYDVLHQFQQRLAQELGAGFVEREQAQKMETFMQRDSRVQRVLEMALEEQVHLQGVPLKTSTYYVYVPSELTYDPLAVRPEKVTKKKKAGRFLRKATKKAFGRDDGPNGPRQRTVAIVTSRMDDLYHGPLNAALFAVPPTCGLAEATR